MSSIGLDQDEVELVITTGEIISNGKFSETKISSFGGGGHVGKEGGYVSAPSITSHSLLHHEFWVKLPNGTEKSFKTINKDIPLRDGQVVSIIEALHNNLCLTVALVNHHSRKCHIINDAEEVNEGLGIRKKLRIKDALWYILGIYVALGLIFMAVIVLTDSKNNSMESVTIPAFGIATLYTFRLWRKRSKDADSFKLVFAQRITKEVNDVLRSLHK